MSVYLNGQMVEAETIDPEKHRFIGTFRTSAPPTFSPKVLELFQEGCASARERGEPMPDLIMMCPCGAKLDTVEGIASHWRMGHFDLPQYVDIAPPEGPRP